MVELSALDVGLWHHTLERQGLAMLPQIDITSGAEATVLPQSGFLRMYH